MNPRIILTDFKAEIKTLLRSKGTLFWTLLFPIMLILIFGAIFSGADDIEFEVHIQDLDDSEMSQEFMNILNETGVIKIEIVDVDINVTEYIEEKNIKRLLIIPEGYEQQINASFIDNNATVNLSFYYDQSEMSSNQIVQNVISNVIRSLNMEFSGGRTIIGVDNIETISGDFGYIDFFLPGMIGFTIMQTCVYGSIERNTKFRKDGILRKMLTTPITRTDWILSKMLFQLFLSFVSALLILVVGVLVYGMTVNINALFFVLIIATSFLFTGMGMMIGRFVKDEESAGMAGGAITFPMMFLAGTFFALDQMPEFLQIVAKFLPLYYVNEGLRNAMIYLNESEAINHTIVVLVIASILFIAGVLLTKWKED